MTLSPVLARELAAQRPRFNAAVAATRRARTGFDLDALAAALRIRLDPLAEAVERVAPERTAEIVDAGFVQSIALVEAGLSAERRALVDRVWSEAAVALVAVVAERPDAVLALLTNAALTLDAMPGARVGEWIARMVSLAPLVTADTIAAAGQVAAWRAGAAHYRAGALAVADALPEPLALAALGASGVWAEVRVALAGDRWWTPDGDAGPIRVGGFTGFGGPFASPPEVRAGAEGFVVQAGAKTALIVADGFGATLHPAAADEFDRAAPAMAAAAPATTLPGDGLRSAVTADSIAFASPWSHHLEIAPWRR